MRVKFVWNWFRGEVYNLTVKEELGYGSRVDKVWCAIKRFWSCLVAVISCPVSLSKQWRIPPWGILLPLPYALTFKSTHIQYIHSCSGIVDGWQKVNCLPWLYAALPSLPVQDNSGLLGESSPGLSSSKRLSKSNIDISAPNDGNGQSGPPLSRKQSDSYDGDTSSTGQHSFFSRWVNAYHHFYTNEQDTFALSCISVYHHTCV